MSRNKGKSGEREVIELLQPIVNSTYAELGLVAPTLKRNTLQSDGGGHDVVAEGLQWLSIEVKRCEVPALSTWWMQCKEQATRAQNQHQNRLVRVEPVLIHRANNRTWRVRMFGCLHVNHADKNSRMVSCPVDIDLEAFLIYFRIRLEYELGKGTR